MSKTTSGFRERNGKWEYRFSHHGTQYSVTGTTQKECKDKAQKRILEASGGLKIDAKSITWEQYTAEWLEHKKVTCRESTQYSYEKKLKMLSELNPKKMVNIDRRDILMLQAHLAKHYCSSTTNWLISIVRHIFNQAIADEIILRNPTIEVKAIKRTEPKATDTIHKALNKDEQERFFAKAKAQNSWYLEMFEFMLATGTRVGEAGALTWKDIDDVIHINKTVAEVGPNKYGIQDTKTEAGCRDLPLTESVKNILIRQKIKVAEHKGVSFTAPDQRIFYSADGTEFANSGMVDNAIEYICKKAKIEKRSSHVFRDTYATKCAIQGMQPNTLKNLMGHSKIATTMDIYAQVMPEDLSEALQQIKIL